MSDASLYDGRTPEPPYVCQSCEDKDAEIERLQAGLRGIRREFGHMSINNGTATLVVTSARCAGRDVTITCQRSQRTLAMNENDLPQLTDQEKTILHYMRRFRVQAKEIEQLKADLAKMKGLYEACQKDGDSARNEIERLKVLEQLRDDVKRLTDGIVRRRPECAMCHGTGSVHTHYAGYIDCPACNGRGH